ncbi:MAG: NAD(P)-dependent oxidoreductase, partial [Pseudoflavonifractor sp.]
RAKGFDMKVLCYDVYPDAAFAEAQGAQYASMDTLLRESDFISLHTPLTEETRNLISARELALMKKTAVLVNTARGGIVEEGALYEALKRGDIAAAALDAMVYEPPCESPLLTLDNFTATSHFGATTYDSVHKMSSMAVDNLIAALETGRCTFAVS